MTEILERLSKAALADHYTLKHELGRGGMAIVYLADDLKHHRSVALKVLHPDLAQTLGAERFQLESNSLRGYNIRISSPCWIPGKPPVNFGSRCRSLRASRSATDCRGSDNCRWTAPCGLPSKLLVHSYAHQHGIIHRDIKPENLRKNAKGGARQAEIEVSCIACVLNWLRINKGMLEVPTISVESLKQRLREAQSPARPRFSDEEGGTIEGVLEGTDPRLVTMISIQGAQRAGSAPPHHAIRPDGGARHIG